MRSLERRFKIEEDKHPEYSNLVNFGHAVQHQRFTKEIIVKWFSILVEKDDYDRQIYDEVIDHMVTLSHSPKEEYERQTSNTDGDDSV